MIIEIFTGISHLHDFNAVHGHVESVDVMLSEVADAQGSMSVSDAFRRLVLARQDLEQRCFTFFFVFFIR